MIETAVAPGNSAGNGNPQHATDSVSASAPARAEPIETAVAPGNSAGQGNSEHDSEPAFASATVTADPIKTGVAPGNSAGRGNSQHASQSAVPNASEPAQPAEAASETGGAGQEPAFHFNNEATPSTPNAEVELEIFDDSPVLFGHDVEPAAIPEAGTAAMNEHAANGQHHVKALLPHDLLI
ncbi:MAG: hypothetical protein Q8M18_14555 [Bradyrhizobium sp.]|nr:hypothetical protein [Bradyrhizobium sp.]